MSDRAELLDLLARDGILRSTEQDPVVAQDGSTVAWMLDSLRVSLTSRGAELAAKLLLAELAKFDATQLATFGVTAVPLMQACISHGGGAYTGLIVRKEPKGYGAGKAIEGPLDPAKPVVIVDDSIASGSSLFKTIAKLEEAGVRVEGCVTLARFGYGRGWARAIARGLRMATVFDVEADLVPIVDPERMVLRGNISQRVPEHQLADERAPDGLHPTELARRVMEAFLDERPVPRAPARLDGDYDAAGGAWVSVRSRADVFQRYGRNGFWVLPEEPAPSAPEAIVKAALRTAKLITRAQLDESAVAVTTFGALERCTPGEIDNERYGILVRGRERPEQWGGALPNMPTMFRDWAQLEHARINNCKLHPFEPFDLFRHTVAKVVEPGARWQPDGVPRPPSPPWHAHGPQIAARARELVRALLHRTEPTGAAIPNHELDGVQGIYVSVFKDGRVLACVGDRLAGSLEETLQRIVTSIVKDPRFAHEPETRTLAVTVSLLDRLLVFPKQLPAAIAPNVDLHRHGLVVQQNARTAFLLPFTALLHSLSQSQFVAELIDKAGITRPPYDWTRVETTSWYADGTTTSALPWGLPAATACTTIAEGVERLVPRMLEYLRVHHAPRTAYYRALVDQELGTFERPRHMHGAWTLALAHRVLGGDALAARAGESIAAYATATDLELNETAVLALALSESDPQHPLLASLLARLAGAIDSFGTIPHALLPSVAQPNDTADMAFLRHEQQLDYVLPQVTLALAKARASDRAAMRRALRRADARFSILPAWSHVCWLPQAAAAAYRLEPSLDTAQIAFRVVDWALPYQQASSGGFINGEQPDSPGCTTAVYLEGVAAALELAVAAGDRERADRYRAACLAALRFVDELTYQERDRAFLLAPERAYGGVRLSRTAGDVRTDFVQHAIHALLRLRSLAT